MGAVDTLLTAPIDSQGRRNNAGDQFTSQGSETSGLANQPQNLVIGQLPAAVQRTSNHIDLRPVIVNEAQDRSGQLGQPVLADRRAGDRKIAGAMMAHNVAKIGDAQKASLGDRTAQRDQRPPVRGKSREVGVSVPGGLTRSGLFESVNADMGKRHSLFSRDAEEQGHIDACKELSMAMMAYAVLGRGMLSEQVPKVEELAADDVRQRLPRFQSVNIEQNLGLRSALEAIARRKNATLAQLAIA
jgi:hypothetical protein